MLAMFRTVLAPVVLVIGFGGVFGTAAHASLPTAEQLPAIVGPLFRTALRLTSVQRRTFQRRDRTRERLRMERRSA